MAAWQGDAFARFHLARMYYHGKGVSPDHAQALHWYHKAAEQGYSLAQYNLGRMYLNGEGTQINIEKAIYWFKKAAEQGNHLAQIHLGLFFESKKEGNEDAAYWYRKAPNRAIIRRVRAWADVFYWQRSS